MVFYWGGLRGAAGRAHCLQSVSLRMTTGKVQQVNSAAVFSAWVIMKGYYLVAATIITLILLPKENIIALTKSAAGVYDRPSYRSNSLDITWTPKYGT